MFPQKIETTFFIIDLYGATEIKGGLSSLLNFSDKQPPPLSSHFQRVPCPISIFKMPSNNSSNDGHDGTAGLSSLLEKHLLGTFKMRLGNITCTEMVRPVNMAGVNRIVQSIRDVEWQSGHSGVPY